MVAARKSATHSAKLVGRLFRPVDSASLVVLRLTFGLLMAAFVTRLFLSGDLDRLYLAAELHFKFPLFGWVPDPAPGWFHAVLALVGVSGLMVAVGFLYRLATVVLFVSWSYVFFSDVSSYQNHEYLMVLLAFLFMLMPLHRAYSVDAMWRPAIRRDWVPAWCLYILRFQIALVYIWGGIRKLNPDWLRGEPIRTMLHTEAIDHAILGRFFFSESLVWTFVYGGLVLDLLVVPALIWRPTRVPAYLVTVAFHLTNAWLWNIDVFPWFMIVATLLFFPPDYPRKVVAMLGRTTPREVTPDDVGAAELHATPRHRAIVAILGVYAVLQILLPCRPFLYPGNPLEQEQLLMFSWNMMLRLDETRVLFVVRDQDSGESWDVEPSEILSGFQLGRQGAPDMMHQAAHFIAAKARDDGHENVSVHMRALTRVHGRPWQFAFDPDLDFAATPRSFGVKSWILPFTERFPPDPSFRTAYAEARWHFCKEQGLLPLWKHARDPGIEEKLDSWDAEFRRTYRAKSQTAQ